ncbi:MAG: SpoIIIAH-like family protein [Lachnospiraceae bacterium]
MKDIVKKNQVMITALALMIAVAGYLHFAGEVSTDDVVEANAEVITDQIVIEDLTDDYLLDSLADISDEDLEEIAMLDGLDSTVDVVLEDYLEDEMVALEEVSATPDDGEIPGETVYTSSVGVSTIADAKLLKEQTRAKNIETLLEIIDNTTLEDTQKQDAIQSMISMTNIAEMETGAEILLEAKGFEDTIVSVSENMVDVIVNAVELSDTQLAQIEDIVIRKTGASADEIVISTLVLE